MYASLVTVGSPEGKVEFLSWRERDRLGGPDDPRLGRDLDRARLRAGFRARLHPEAGARPSVHRAGDHRLAAGLAGRDGLLRAPAGRSPLRPSIRVGPGLGAHRLQRDSLRRRDASRDR